MNYSQVFAISASGMDLERTRYEVAALNMRNANTVAGPDGQVYQPLRVVAQAVPFGDSVTQGLSDALVQVQPTLQPPRKVYEPGNPGADAQGYVAYANVDIATETFTMMTAQRAYEANVAAINMARNMALKALEIGSK